MSDVPDDLVARSATIPDAVAITTLDVSELPRDWQAYPAPDPVTALGAAWIERGETAVLAVPSVVVPTESNYLLNPRHRDFSRIQIGSAHAFALDPRLRRRA